MAEENDADKVVTSFSQSFPYVGYISSTVVLKKLLENTRGAIVEKRVFTITSIKEILRKTKVASEEIVFRSGQIDNQIDSDRVKVEDLLVKKNDFYVAVSKDDRNSTLKNPGGWLSISVGAKDPNAFDDCQKFLKSIVKYTKPVETDDSSIPIKFWYLSPSQGACSVNRAAVAPRWETISQNYSVDTTQKLTTLMNWGPADLNNKTGKIIIFHGPAGTGKTTAIRALAQEWRKFCEIEFIIDPEQFFGSGDYMLDVLVEGEVSRFDYDDDDDLLGLSSVPKTKWKLLVIEDADAYLRQDAQLTSGQAMQRLLSLGDGLLGQGLQIVMLMTTNVPVDKLNEAVTRPGRCITKIHVPKLTAEEASKLLGKKVDKEMSLADIFVGDQIVVEQDIKRTKGSGGVYI